MAVAVKIPVALRPATGGESQVAVEGTTVSEVLDSLFERFGELRERISDESGSLRRFVNVYVAGEDIRFLEGLDTPVADGSELTILPAVAGGARAHEIKWLDEPEEKDYAAARSYLSLLVPGPVLDGMIRSLAQAPKGSWRAKDILRAAHLPLLSKAKSTEVDQKLAHIRDGMAISPILLIVLRNEVVLQIADGYHRTCAAYITDEDSLVPGRLLFTGG